MTFVIRAFLTVHPALSYIASSVGALNDSSPFFYWEPTGVSATCGASGLAANVCVGVDAFTYQFLQDGIDLLPSNLSTFTFDTTNATGDLFFSLDPDGAGFFGLPGTTAVVALVPEPATALFLGLGLVVLAGARGRRH